MGDKRLHAHMTWLVTNLDYAYESGRKMVLEVMARLAAKFPQPIMDQYLEMFLLPLVRGFVCCCTRHGSLHLCRVLVW